jgi:hypothetical protein
MLRDIDSREVTAPHSRNALLLASTLMLGAATVSGELGSMAEPQQESFPPTSGVPVGPGNGAGLEAVRSTPIEKPQPAFRPERTVEAFTESWIAGERVAARRVAGRGVYRDLTRLANRYAIAQEPAGRATAICSEGRDIFCRVFVPNMLEVDARLAERHGEFVVLGFKLPTAG